MSLKRLVWWDYGLAAFNDTWVLLWSIGNRRLTLGELLDGDQGAADEEEAATDQVPKLLKFSKG